MGSDTMARRDLRARQRQEDEMRATTIRLHSMCILVICSRTVVYGDARRLNGKMLMTGEHWDIAGMS